MGSEPRQFKRGDRVVVDVPGEPRFSGDGTVRGYSKEMPWCAKVELDHGSEVHEIAEFYIAPAVPTDEGARNASV